MLLITHITKINLEEGWAMSLNHAILGLLTREPMTGYEIKKIFQSTPFMHWSGNNNQIYKAFAELLDEGFVAKEVRHQDGSPSKNIYSITGAGLREFRRWLAGATEEPVCRKQILIKLALADGLKRAELERLADAYAGTVRLQAAMAEQELDKCYFAGRKHSGTNRFFDLIRENVLANYAFELDWIRKVKALIAELPEEDDAPAEPEREEHKAGLKMIYQVKERRGKRYLHIASGGTPIEREKDANAVIELCVEHDTNAVLLDGYVLSDAFFTLRTGLAGAVLQKFVNFSIKTAAVIEEGRPLPVRFREMVFEYRSRSTFCVFTNPEEAVDWLLA
jgi:DNA-binding PadR family transcriptional regulator